MIDAATAWDVFGVLRSIAAFAMLLVAPGYCLGWVANLLGFRRRGAAEQLTWSVALSFAVVPVVVVLLAKAFSAGVVCGLAELCTAVAVFLAYRSLTRASRARGRWAWGIAAGVAWAVFCVIALVDIGVGSRLYLSVTIFDHALRTAFVDAVMRTGVPPTNPLFWAGHAAPMRYYYFWYVLAAVAAKVGAASARQALIASVVWAGFGLATVVALYCRYFFAEQEGTGTGRRWPRSAIGIALLAIAGLDILPAAAKALVRMPTDPDMDWWSPDQVTTWLGSLLWVPHHVAALVACVTGFLLVWISRGRSTRQRVTCAVVAGLGFASAFGLSTWVAVAFAMAAAIWAVWVLVWEPQSRERVAVLVGAGVIAVIVLLPYLHELQTEVSGTVTVAGGEADAQAGASHLLRLGVRHMIDPEPMQIVPGFAALATRHPQLENALAGVVLLVPGYFVELGFWGIVLIAALRARGLGEAERTARVIVIAGLVVTTFLRSTVVTNNDFGMRSALIPQFFLLLSGVRWIEGALHSSKWMRKLGWAMLWIGVAGTVYQAVLLRTYLPVEDRLGRAAVGGLGEHAMALRTAMKQMDQVTSAAAVVQFNIVQPSDYFVYAQVLLAGRQMATALPTCPAAFGGDPAACAAVQGTAKQLFSTSNNAALTAAQARAECSRLGITNLIATRWDGVWQDHSGWVWNLPKVVDSKDVFVVDCTPDRR